MTYLCWECFPRAFHFNCFPILTQLLIVLIWQASGRQLLHFSCFGLSICLFNSSSNTMVNKTGPRSKCTKSIGRRSPARTRIILVSTYKALLEIWCLQKSNALLVCSQRIPYVVRHSFTRSQCSFFIFFQYGLKT